MNMMFSSKKYGCRLVLLLGTILFSKVVMAATNVTRPENDLLRDIFRDYNKESRPVLNQSHSVVSQFGIALTEILDLDEKNQILTTNVWVRQIWKDPLLAWNASHYGGLSSINISPELVWRPDIVLYNNVNDEDRGEQYLFNTKVIVHSDGTIEWYSPNILKTNCKIDIKYFPFDTQTCKLIFGSWTFNGFKLNITFYHGRAEVDTTKFSINGEWDLVSAVGVRNVVKYSCCPEPYPDLTFSIKIRRRSLFYVTNLIMPCIILALLTGVSFLFPPETGERISLVVTVLLGMTVFMIIFTEAVPSTSEATPLIAKYFAAVLVEISLCLVGTCVPLKMFHLHPGTEMPRWVRVLMFDVIGKLVCYNCSCKLKSDVVDLKKEHELNNHKLSEAAVIENGGFVQEYSDDNGRNSHNESLPKILFSPSSRRGRRSEEKPHGVSVLVEHVEKIEWEDRLKVEWKEAVSILDRLFFCIFVLTFCFSSLAILLGPRD